MNARRAALPARPPAAAGLPIGDTTVTCAVADTFDNTNSCAFTVHVRGASEQLSDLISAVEGFGLAPGVQTTLCTNFRQSLVWSINTTRLRLAGSCRRWCGRRNANWPTTILRSGRPFKSLPRCFRYLQCWVVNDGELARSHRRSQTCNRDILTSRPEFTLSEACPDFEVGVEGCSSCSSW